MAAWVCSHGHIPLGLVLLPSPLQPPPSLPLPYGAKPSRRRAWVCTGGDCHHRWEPGAGRAYTPWEDLGSWGRSMAVGQGPGPQA